MKRFLTALIAAWLLIITPAYAVEVDLQWAKGTQFFDDAGSILDSGTINIYDATTTDNRTTYSDSGGTVANTLNGSNQIVIASDGRLSESVYIPTGSWKFVLKDSGGTTLVTEDSIEGALDTSVFVTGSAAWSVPVLSKSSDYTVTTSDLGKCINANPTSAGITLTLPSAATAGDGKTLCARHIGTANTVTIATVSSQTIDGFDTFVLSDQYDTALLVSDGANWHIAAQSTPPGSIQFSVTDRLTAPPTSPTPGAWYIIDGTPTGDWSAYADEDIVRAAGDGGWHKFTPPTDSGWLAYVTDENILTQFRDSAWVDFSNITAPSASDLNRAVYQHQQTSGTVGGSATSGSYQKYPLTTEVEDTGVGSSISSSVISLPAGTYKVDAWAVFQDTDATQIRVRDTTAGATLINGTSIDVAGVGVGGIAQLTGVFTISVTSNIELQYDVGNAVSTSDLGNPSSTAEIEVYGQISFLDLSATQGPTGATGAAGATGVAGFPGHVFDFDTDTDNSVDGDNGDLRLSSGTLSAVTTISVDDLDRNGLAISTDILSWDDQTSSTRGTVTLRSEGTVTDLAVYDITGASVDASGWTDLTVTAVTSFGTFTEGEDVTLAFARTGDAGATGATGATGVAGPTLAVGWTYSATTTDSDPGSGIFRLDNATPASAANAYFDNNEIGGTDVSTFLDTWDDNGTSAKRGTLTLTDASDSTVFYVYTVTGTVTDGTGYRKVALTYVAGAGTLAGEVHAHFTNRGDTGSGDTTGPASSVDNELVQFDGVTGKTLESVTATGIVVTNSGVITAGRIATASAAAAEEGITITNGSGVSGNPTIGLDITGLSADTSLAATDTLPHYDGTNNKKVTVDNLFKRTETFVIPAGALITAITNGASIGTTSIGAYGSAITLPTAAYDASTQEEAVFVLSMPDSWDVGTIIASEIHWTAASGSGTVGWGISCGAAADDVAITTSTYGTEQFHVDTLITAYDNHVISSTTEITVANAAASTLIACRVRQDVNESIAVDALLLSITFEYGVNARSD